MIAERAELTKGSDVKFFNANGATLLYSLKAGYAGYSGIMTNFHTDLYHRLCSDWKQMGDEAEALQAYLGASSTIESQFYPANARYLLMKEGVFSNLISRRQDARLRQLSDSEKMEMDQFYVISKGMSERYAKS